MNRFRSKRILGNLALVVISLGISFFLAEILLRQAFPIDTGTSYQHRVPHPVLGWVLEPNASYLNRMPEATVRVKYNSKGWRDANHDLENHRGAFRILVLGDSFMEAYSVKFDEAFHKQIEQFARENGIDVEVINLGVGGYGTLQEYLVFREIGKFYKPNIVLLGFFVGNDVRNNSKELESIVNTKSIKVETRPFLDSADLTDWNITVVDYKGAQSRYAEVKARQTSFPRNLVKHSALLQISRIVKRNVVSRLSAAEKPRAGQTEQKRRYLALYGSNFCEEQPEYTKAWDITTRILDRLNHDTKTIGGKLFVFNVPAFHETEVTKMAELIEDAPNSVALCLEDAPAYKRLQNILTELDIEYIDLLPEFRNVMRNSGANLFWRSDRHWNPEGHALAAKIVGSHLVEKNLLILSNTDAAQ